MKFSELERKVRQLVVGSLIAATALSPGCFCNDKKNPVEPEQETEVMPTRTTEVLRNKTDRRGRITLESDLTPRVIVEVRNSITQKPVEDIIVTYVSNPENNSAAITFEDTTGNYFSDIQYLFPLSRKPEGESKIFSDMNPVSQAPFAVKAPERIPQHLDPSEYELLGTFPLSDIEQVYKENDFFAKNASIIEFISKKSTHPSIILLTKTNQARNMFLEYSVDVTRTISNIFGGTMDPDAMYWDVYSININGFPVVTKDLNTEDGLCTVKGTVTHETGSPLSDVFVGIGNNQTLTDPEGQYRLTHINRGIHNIRFEKEGFEPFSLDTLIQPAPYPDFISTYVNPILRLEEVLPLISQIIWTDGNSIYLGDPNGSFSKPLRLRGIEPNISQNGKEIVYSSGEQIFIADVNGNTPRILVDRSESNYGGPWGPVWSPSGNQIAFYERVGEGFSNDIFLVDRESKKVSRLTNLETDIRDISWSPSEDLLFSAPHNRRKEIQRLDLETGELTVLTKGNETDKYDPELSPDGSYLTYTEWTIIPTRRNWLGFTIAPETYKSEIYILNLSTSEKIQLTRNEKTNWPSWSPNGERIIFSRYNGDDYDLFTINRDGTGLTQVTDTRNRSEIYPDWSPR